MSKPVLLLGAGGHAYVLLDILQRLGKEVINVVAPVDEGEPEVFLGVERLVNDDSILQFNPDSVFLVNGIGSIPGSNLRKKIYQKFKALGYEFMTVVAPSAEVSPYAVLLEGAQVLSGSVVQAGAQIGENSIVNTRASVDHGVKVSAYCHLAPAACVSGDTVLLEDVHVGTGAVIVQGIVIGDSCVVGAGACITKDLKSNSTVFPAKVFIKEE